MGATGQIIRGTGGILTGTEVTTWPLGGARGGCPTVTGPSEGAGGRPPRITHCSQDPVPMLCFTPSTCVHQPLGHTRLFSRGSGRLQQQWGPQEQRGGFPGWQRAQRGPLALVGEEAGAGRSCGQCSAGGLRMSPRPREQAEARAAAPANLVRASA